jgi:hypothetical protein
VKKRHKYASAASKAQSTREIDVYPCLRPNCDAALAIVRWQDGRSVSLRRYQAAPDEPWSTTVPPCGGGGSRG